MTRKISILGCGWLGTPLALSLLKEGFDIKGSTTSAEKTATLADIGIRPFCIQLGETHILGNVTLFLEQSEVLIILIPPGMRRQGAENFLAKIKTLIPYIEKARIQKVIFVSSTSVYNNSIPIATEQTPLVPDTEVGIQLLASERVLQENPKFKTTVLRFGGLVGEDRNPVQYLARLNEIENPDAPINLIHQDDCIGIIKEIINQNVWGETFNAVSPIHPTRKEYYTRKAEALGLTLPKFASMTVSEGKIVSSEKVIKLLNYAFIKPDL